MKRLICIAGLLWSLLPLAARQIQLHWLPVETLVADNVSMQAVALEHGIYMRSRQLPSYIATLPHAGEPRIENITYTTPTADERAIIATHATQIPDTVSFLFFGQTERKQTTYKIEVFPFVRIEGEIQKIQSFDIQQNTPKNQAITKHAAASYTANSVLRRGKFVKIAVSQSGIHKLTYEELVKMGIDPQNVRIFGYGGAMLAEDFTQPYIDDLPEVAIYEYRGNDNVFGAGDYILFYAQGPTSWLYYPEYQHFRHTQNVYSDYGYYFVTSDAGIGKRITQAEALDAEPSGTLTTFIDYFVHEKDLVNLIGSGREFYGEQFSEGKLSHSFSFAKPNIIADEASIRLNVAVKSQTSSQISIAANNTNIGALTTPSLIDAPVYEYAKTAATIPDIKFTPTPSNSLQITLKYGDSNGTAWLNYFEVNIRRKLQLTNQEPLFFRNIDSLATTTAQRFSISGTTATTQIWDITDQQNIKQMAVSRQNNISTFIDSVSTLKEYVAIDPVGGTFLSPTIIGVIDNQNLHALPQTDMVIIAPAEFLDEAERLAEAHRSVQNLRVQVVNVEHVYNEFSSGTPDATAYRRVMKLFYDRASDENDMPRYLLLFGDGCYDNRHIEVKEDYAKLLTFQSVNSVHGTSSYVCDDYFALLDDTDGKYITTDAMDIGIGRLPVHTQEQARIAVDKSISYLENQLTGSWKNQLVFVADDGDNNLHITSCDSVANMTQHTYADFLVRKLYLDAYTQEVSASGETYPLAIEMFDNYIKNGTLMINYMGHGGHTDWANEGILTHDRIVNMYNDKYPLFVTATCDFSRFDGTSQSGGELLLLNSHGGAIALFTTTRTVYAEPNFRLNLQFAKYIFARDSLTRPLCFGDVMRNAKNALSVDPNRMNFTLLGDPALHLAYASTHDVVTDSITLSGTSTDTIRALSQVRIHGHIAPEGSTEVDDTFNGYVTLNVFDKVETIKTLCNDATGNTNNIPYTFTDRTSTLFIGSVIVTDGQFTVDFIVPKDIRYNYGTGRIVYYAVDTINNYEANGYYEQFTIGGEDPNAPTDDEGPQITMYLNTPSFKSGDKTNESPLFVAHVADDYGINAIGSGIGHDILLKLDNDPQQETILNSYYITNMGEYTSGTIKYQFTELPEGKHHLFFRVWDLQNNSSTAELDFEVVRGLRPNLYDMFVYPNPASNAATFVYVHDRPEQPLNVTATVADLAGRIIYTGEQTVYTYDNRTEIVWNFAGNISPGIYLVRMTVQVSDSETLSKTLKLMVKKQ
ncbi:MAG: type IX secretion system sortase PorU [Paludibacteraceae bacterium]